MDRLATSLMFLFAAGAASGQTAVEPFAHRGLAGAARDVLEHPHDAVAHAGGERLVALPLGPELGLAVPVEDLVLVRDRADFEADERVGNLEGGGGQETLLRA